MPKDSQLDEYIQSGDLPGCFKWLRDNYLNFNLVKIATDRIRMAFPRRFCFSSNYISSRAHLLQGVVYERSQLYRLYLPTWYPSWGDFLGIKVVSCSCHPYFSRHFPSPLDNSDCDLALVIQQIRKVLAAFSDNQEVALGCSAMFLHFSELTCILWNK